MKDYRDILSKRIRQLRKEQRISASKISQEIGLSRTALSRIEGKRSAPSIEVLCQIAEKLKCTPDYLLGFIDEPRPPEPIEKIWPEAASLIKKGLEILDDEEKEDFLIAMEAFLLHVEMLKKKRKKKK
jgi:transcriptional regulator with XRE-family HTH domain